RSHPHCPFSYVHYTPGSASIIAVYILAPPDWHWGVAAPTVEVRVSVVLLGSPYVAQAPPVTVMDVVAPRDLTPRLTVVATEGLIPQVKWEGCVAPSAVAERVSVVVPCPLVVRLTPATRVSGPVTVVYSAGMLFHSLLLAVLK